MKERDGETGTYTPLLAFAKRTAQNSSQNEQQIKEETCTQEKQEKLEKEQYESKKDEVEEEEWVHEHNDQTMNMLKSELVECLRILHAQGGVNDIQELLKEADIALPLLALEESKNAQQPSSESLQLLPSEEKEFEQYNVNIEEQDVKNMTEVFTLHKERNELAQELECVKNELHSCTSQLMESLPSLVNAIDVTRRELLLPLYRLTAMYSSASSERVLARRQLFHLHKHPTNEVRKRIVKEWLALIFLSSTSSSFSRETTWLQLEREILPELFQLGNSRLVEQRLLALECVCGLSIQLTLVLNSTNRVLCTEHSREELKSKKGISPIDTRKKIYINIDTCNDTTLGKDTLESVEAVERIYELLYHGLLRPLCDDTSALVREQVVMCIASLWPSFQTTSIEYTKDIYNNDNVEPTKIGKNSKPIKHMLLTETLPRMMEMIIELALDAASGTVRHVAQAQLRSVIFVRSFHSQLLLTSFVPLLLVFVEKELREMLQLTTSSSSVLSLSESPSTLPTTNYNTENIIKPNTTSSTTTAPAVAATVATSDQNAQSVFAHTRPSTLRSMLKSNVYALIRLIHDVLHCAVAQTIHVSKQRLVKVEECNNTCSGTNNKNMALANISHAECKEHKEHIILKQEEEEEYKKNSEEKKIATKMNEINNNTSDDECKTNYVRHKVNQIYTYVVLPLFTQTMQNICAMATGNKQLQIQQEEIESTFVDIVCRLSYTMALFCKLFDWQTWLQVQKHLFLTLQSEYNSQAKINSFNSDSKIDNNTNTNTTKITERPHYMSLRMVFAFLLRVASESALGSEQNMEICKIKEINSMAVSRDESICRISKSATVCFVHIVASGVAPRYTSDECFNVAAEVIAQSASVAKHDLKLTRAIKRVLKVMYNFVVYKDECSLECDANVLEDNSNKNNSKSDMENEQIENKENNNDNRESTDDLASYTESCQLWCIVFIVKICELLEKENEEITSTLFCAFLHQLIDKTTDDNDDTQNNLSVKVKEEVICALMQTVLPLNDVNEQLALLTPALEILNECKVTAHIYERVLHIMFILISRGITAEAREIIIYPFLEMIINKLSESSLSYAEMLSTVNELMQVLEAILRCAVVTPSLVNEHLLKPMMEFTTHKMKRTTTTVNETFKTNMSAMTSANPSLSNTRIASVPSSHDKWLDLLLRYQGFVERNRENSFVSHFVSSPLLIRMKDELRKRLERM